MNSRATIQESAQLRACDLARDYGFTARHWLRLAAAGKIPGARQPAGAGGHWLFERRGFVAYARQAGLIRSAEPIQLRKPLRPSRPNDVVYAIYSAGHIKFGVSSNVTRRRHSFTTASPAPVVLLATVEGSNDLELAIQRRLGAFRTRGEWFRLSPEVREFVEQIRRDGKAVSTLESAELEFRQWLSEHDL